MKCPQCKAWTRVLDTRQRADNSSRRRHECANGHRFFTVERVEPSKTPAAPVSEAA